MQSSYYLARDHLEQAVSILRGTDTQTQQLRYIVERTIDLMAEFERRERRSRGNVISFDHYVRERRLME